MAAVLSGNRNFEGRIHPQVRASYLASPPLVVAYALAGTVDIDLTSEPIGEGSDGEPVYLSDIWPTAGGGRTRRSARRRSTERCSASSTPTCSRATSAGSALPVPEGDTYAWDPESTYVQEPPFFEGLTPEPAPLTDITGARVLAMLGDSITTDHISPAGIIPKRRPPGSI